MVTSEYVLFEDSRGYWVCRFYAEDKKQHTASFGKDERTARRRFNNWKAKRNFEKYGGATVADSMTAYMAWATARYVRASGEPTGEADNVRYALQPFIELFPDLEGDVFEVADVKTYRQWMTDEGMARTTINKRVGIVKRWAAWAEERGHIERGTTGELVVVKGLRMGQTGARESAKVRAVSEADVEQTIEHCPPTVAAMIRLQLLTAMRPEEVWMMRGCDIDVSREPWEYRPQWHKNAHHGEGHERVIFFGPAARELLIERMTLKLTGYLFSPADAVEERRGRRSKGAAGHAFKPHYDTRSYRRAVEYACIRAFGRREDGEPVNIWTPNQLRHTALTRIQRAVGVDTARAVAGHKGAATTALYLERDHGAARAIMERAG
jgi:integrase